MRETAWTRLGWATIILATASAAMDPLAPTGAVMIALQAGLLVLGILLASDTAVRPDGDGSGR